MEEQENRSEYKTLSETLGRRLQVSLSDFQEMKYNNSEEYKELAERAEWLRSEFPSEKSLSGHFESHGKEFGKITKYKYQKKQPSYCLNPFLRVYWDTTQKPAELDITKRKIL